MSVSPPPDGLWSNVRPDLPTALLPVRLETRYGERLEADANIPVLRVRIYPDEVSTARPSRRLSNAEREAGTHYWTNRADPGLDDHERRGAWEVLCQRVGVARALHVARSTQAGFVEPDQDLDASYAQLLPDSWVLVGEAQGRTVLTHFVQRAPADPKMGPSRSAVLPQPEPGRDPFAADTELGWLTDFRTALAIGMAAEIDLVGDAAAGVDGLSALYVVGLREQDAATDTATFADVLARHAADDRLAFVPTGTPTNVLTDAPSGWSSAPDVFAQERRLVTEDGNRWREESTSPLRGGGDSGAIFQAAFGLSDQGAPPITGAEGQDQWLARQMSEALFAVTLGEAVSTLGRRTPPPFKIPEGEEAERYVQALHRALPFAREHFSSYVRGRGPLPALRIGRQPYGLLPVMPARNVCVCGTQRSLCSLVENRCCRDCVHWFGADHEDSRLHYVVEYMELLRPFWDAAVTGVPRVRREGNQQLDLGRVLCESPVPHPGAYRVRDIVGAVAATQARLISSHIRVDVPGAGAMAFTELADRLLEQQGILASIQALAARRVLSEIVDVLRGTQLEDLALAGDQPLRVDVAATNKQKPDLSPAQYLSALSKQRGSFVSAALAALTEDEKPRDLLYVLLEYSISLGMEQDQEIIAASAARDRFLRAASVSREFVDTKYSAGQAIRQLHTLTLGDLTPVSEAAAFSAQTLENLVVNPDVAVQVTRALGLSEGIVFHYSATRAAIGKLADAGLSDEEYTGLLGETLSTVSTRLDAWVTSLATARLDAVRQATPEVTQFGAWGVLVDIQPETRPEPGIFDRTAWHAHLQATQDPTPRLSRPRDPVGYVHAPSLAQAVTAGVLRAGEVAHRGDGTHLASLDLTSRRVRLAREVITGMQHGQPLGALLGYRLERMLHEKGMHDLVSELRTKFPQRRYTGAEGTEAGTDDVVPAEIVDGFEVWQHRADLTAQIGADIAGRLHEMVEAVTDLIVAEGVHQITTGRPQSAGAVFDAIAYGAAPPEPAVANEPRSGTTVTHKVVIADDGNGTAGWNMNAPRAILAPSAERWAQQVLGPASTWILNPAGQPVSLDTLHVCALDVLCETRATIEEGAVPALDGIVAAPTGLPFDDRLVAAAGAADFTTEDPQRRQLYALAATAYEVLANARPLTAKDTTYTGQGATIDDIRVQSPPPVEASELAQQVCEPLTQLQRCVGGILKSARLDTPPEAVPVSDLKPIADLGIKGSRTLADQLPFATALAAANVAAGILRDIDKLLQGKRSEVTTALPASIEDETWLAYAQEAMTLGGVDVIVKIARLVGGSAVVPCVTVQSDLAAHEVEGLSPGDADRWIVRLSRVRDPLAAYEDVRAFRESRDEPTDHVLFQVPWQEGDNWIGSPHHIDSSLPPRDHLLIAGNRRTTTAPSLTGFVIDEVSEVLPSDTVTTGVAVHYNAPSARPPQAILLAVHPNQVAPWHWKLAIDCIRESLELAKIRGVDLDDLEPLGLTEYLPLTYVKEREGASDLSDLTKRDLMSILSELIMKNANRYLMRDDG